MSMTWCDRLARQQSVTCQMGLNAQGLSATGHGHAPSAAFIHSVDRKPEMRPAATGDPGG